MRQLPNILTVGRGLTGLALYAAYAGDYGSPAARWTMFAAYVVAAATDWLDGWLAKKYGWQTTFGRHADPVADKALFWAVFGILWCELVPPRSSLLALAVMVAAYDLATFVTQGLEVLGKLNMTALNLTRLRSLFLQVGLGGFLLARACAPLALADALLVVALALLASGGALTLFTAGAYLWRFFRRPSRLHAN